VIGRQDYQWRHEAILYGWLPGADRTWLGQRNKNTVIETLDRASIEALDHADLVDIVGRLLEDRPGTVVRVGKVRDQGDHPTPKPVDLVLRTMRNSADAGAVVADPFGGSGTTLLAAEQSDRQALLIELEPGYCDVIVARWEELSGEKAERPKRGRR
jgi:DNA modification methylase